MSVCNENLPPRSLDNRSGVMWLESHFNNTIMSESIWNLEFIRKVLKTIFLIFLNLLFFFAPWGRVRVASHFGNEWNCLG